MLRFYNIKKKIENILSFIVCKSHIFLGIPFFVFLFIFGGYSLVFGVKGISLASITSDINSTIVVFMYHPAMSAIFLLVLTICLLPFLVIGSLILLRFFKMLWNILVYLHVFLSLFIVMILALLKLLILSNMSWWIVLLPIFIAFIMALFCEYGGEENTHQDLKKSMDELLLKLEHTEDLLRRK